MKTLRSRVWNLLKTAKGLGHAGVTIATLAAVLNTSPEGVLTAVMDDMLEAPEGQTAPPLYCEPSEEGPKLTPRFFL